MGWVGLGQGGNFFSISPIYFCAMQFERLPSAQTKALLTPQEQAANAKSLSLCSNASARAQLSYEVASTLCVLPLGFTTVNSRRQLQVAIPEGEMSSLVPQVRFATDCEVRPVEIDKKTLQKAIDIAYRSDDRWLKDGIQVLTKIETPKAPIASSFHLSEDSSSPVPHALRTLLEYAVARDASDIHLVPTVDGMTVKLRINGELLSHQEAICSPEVGKQLISRIKVLATLRIDERFLPQDGAFSLSLKGGPRQLRVSTLPTIHGEKCVLRLTSESALRDLGDLGLSDQTLTCLGNLMQSRRGLLLVTGSTGSGKSTTLYAAVQNLIRQNLSIASVEDPVESHISGISQTSLMPEKGLDYPNALRSILRQDPDVILVGEIRDLESAKLVISAALTGHLVLSSVHGSSVKEAISRLLQMGIERDLLQQVLSLVLSQSLVRTLCSACKVIDITFCRQFDFKIYKPVGCSRCDYSGFDGRRIVVERMRFDEHFDLKKFLGAKSNALKTSENYEPSSYYLRRYAEQGLLVPNLG